MERETAIWQAWETLENFVQDPRATFSSTLQRQWEKIFSTLNKARRESRVYSVCCAHSRAIVFRLKMSSSLEYPRYENKYRIARIYTRTRVKRRRIVRANAVWKVSNMPRALYAITIRSSMKPSNGLLIALYAERSTCARWHSSSCTYTSVEERRRRKTRRRRWRYVSLERLVHGGQLRRGSVSTFLFQPIPIGDETRYYYYHRHWLSAAT